MRWPSTRRRGDRVDATVAADPPTTQARATTRADELERALAREAEALARCATAEGALEDVCRAATAFALFRLSLIHI